MPKLLHTRAGKTIDEYDLQPGTMTIGRHPDCFIQLADDVTVSGTHAQITVSDSEYLDGLLDIYIEDQNSTNGTLVSGKHIKRHLLKNGEVAKIGSHEFTLVDEKNRAFERTQVVIPEDE